MWLERFKPFLDKTEAGGPGPGLDLIPPEVFLIVPALNRKVAEGKATPMELLAAALIQDVQRAILSEAGAASSDIPKVVSTPRNRDFSRESVLAKLDELQNAIPRLRDAEIMDDLGLPDVALRALKSFWAARESAKEIDDYLRRAGKEPEEVEAKPHHTLTPLADAFVTYLDNTAWSELAAALDDIIAHKAPCPTLASAIKAASSEEGLKASSPAAYYGRALSAILSSPLVYFNRAMIFQAYLLI